jgi:hypothetical protein
LRYPPPPPGGLSPIRYFFEIPERRRRSRLVGGALNTRRSLRQLGLSMLSSGI